MVFPAHRRRPPVSRQLSGFLSSYRPLNQLSFRFILPWRSSSSEFLRSNLPPIIFRRGQTYPGSRPSSRHHRSASTFAKVTKPSLRSVLRFSQPLDGFLRPPAVQAYSIPPPRPGLSPFRGFSPRAAELPHREPIPPCRCLLERSPSLAQQVRFRVPSRSPAATLREASASRHSSARGRVVYGWGLASP